MISSPIVCGSFRKRRLTQPNSAERLSSNAAISKMESMGGSRFVTTDGEFRGGEQASEW